MSDTSTVVVFGGPSVPASTVRELLPGAIAAGPAACGDVFKAVRRGATRIGIIDGYFEHHLSVWHKEVLWAISEGAVVYGAASMGALRAAELHPFGMLGVGEIYRAFCDGTLEDDDEVAVLHGDGSRGHAPLSDAMVNIRATLRHGLSRGAISVAAHDAVVRSSKQTFYRDRSLKVAAESAARILGTSDAEALLEWVRQAPLVDQKRLDALELLAVMRTDQATGTPPVPPRFHFENTDSWQTLLRNVAETRDSRVR